MKSCTELRNKIEQIKGRKNLLISQQSSAMDKVKLAGLLGRKLEEAQTIINTVALQTQQELQFHISNITTAALEAVFPDPYEFQINFVERGGKTEADAVFIKDGTIVDPMTGSGGGAVDVAAFSLRASIWRLKGSRPVLFLDEPFKFLSKNMQPLAATMLKEISQKLHLQIIMVTHLEELINAADRVFVIKRGCLKSIKEGGQNETKN